MKIVRRTDGKKISKVLTAKCTQGHKMLFFVFLCGIFLFWQLSQMRKTSLRFLDQSGAEHVLSLSVKDKKKLFCFLRILFAEDTFAYTILGSKPVSWVCYKNHLPFVNLPTFCDSWKKHHRILREGWKTWLKLSQQFPFAKFISEHSAHHPGWVSILLINEEQFNDIVIKNKIDFQSVLQREVIDGFQLLKEAKSRPLMSEIMKRHQALIGTVLGYGRNNSWEFLRGVERGEPISCVWDEKEDSSERKQIRTRLAATDIETCLSIESIPSFAGIPDSQESLALKRDYLQTRQKIINYYKGKDFLEATLSLLAGFRPTE
jgi:hypothetical protein